MLIIDRFENGFVVAEDAERNEMINIPVSKLPEGACEGSVLKRTKDGYTLDKEDEKRTGDIIALFERLKKKK